MSRQIETLGLAENSLMIDKNTVGRIQCGEVFEEDGYSIQVFSLKRKGIAGFILSVNPKCAGPIMQVVGGMVIDQAVAEGEGHLIQRYFKKVNGTVAQEKVRCAKAPQMTEGGLAHKASEGDLVVWVNQKDMVLKVVCLTSVSVDPRSMILPSSTSLPEKFQDRYEGLKKGKELRDLEISSDTLVSVKP